MPAPSSPSLNNLVVEGLKKAGEYSPTAALITRAEGTWMEEIKEDLMTRIQAKKLKSLMTTNLQTLTNGRQEYDNPSDFSQELSMTFKTGSIYGTAQAGAAGSITLAAGEAATDLVAREIIIYSGTGAGQARFITAYDTVTKIATIAPNWTVNPGSGSLYLVVGYSRPVALGAVWDYDKRTAVGRGEPEMFHPLGDATSGKYILNPVPYRFDLQPMILQQRYYADLMKLDLSGTLLSTLYQKWRMLWVLGIKWKHFETENDDRETKAEKQFEKFANKIISIEQYGVDSSNQQIHVMDYN